MAYFAKTIGIVIGLAAAAIALAAQARAQEVKPLAAGRLQGPMEIRSERLMADNKANRVVFEGAVVATSGDMTLRADRMEVAYKEGEVESIVAERNVKLVRAAGVLTAGHAVYTASDRKIVFTRDPKAVEGRNVITGSKMVYLIDEDRSIVENSRLFIEGREGGK